MNPIPRITKYLLTALLATMTYTVSPQPNTVRQMGPVKSNTTLSASHKQSLPFFSRVYQQASPWAAKALIIGAIGFGIYYLANKQLAKKKTTPPNQQRLQQTQKNNSSKQKNNQNNAQKSIPTKQLEENKTTQVQLNLVGAPANFSHSGPICYRNSLFQVLCHADGIAPAIFAELQKSPPKAQSTKDFYNLMTSSEKIKNWSKYTALNNMLFTAVGEKVGDRHDGQDPALTIFSYFGLNNPFQEPNLTSEKKEFASILLAPLTFTRVKKSNKKTQKMSCLNVAREETSALALQRDILKSFPITALPQCLYVYDGCACKASKTVDLAPICHTMAKARSKELYDLVGIVCHIKSQFHYIAYIRRNNQWYRCDDIGTIKKIDNPFDTNGIWNHKVNDLDEEPKMLFYAKQETA